MWLPFRVLALLLLILVPPAALGWLVLGIPGLLAGALLAYAYLMYAALSSERIVLAALRPAGTASSLLPGLRDSLDQVLARLTSVRLLKVRNRSDSELLRPEVVILAEPLPLALVVRSLSGPGSIVLSRGLVELLEEVELRAVLVACLLCNQQSEWSFRSLCSAIAVQLASLVPADWKLLLLSEPEATARSRGRFSAAGLFRFAMVLPLTGALRRLAGVADVSGGEIAQASHYPVVAANGAMRKIGGAASLGGWRGPLGSELLAVADPRSCLRILP
ncbi:MAG: hypothetical protein NDJ90_03460 [Oligoflexia bacterium]|nr:hypothetical protein [Oligoflexia bacterium]